MLKEIKVSIKGGDIINHIDYLNIEEVEATLKIEITASGNKITSQIIACDVSVRGTDSNGDVYVKLYPVAEVDEDADQSWFTNDIFIMAEVKEESIKIIY